jgi:hypothetical protein
LSTLFNVPTLQNPDHEASGLRPQEVRDKSQQVKVAVGQAAMSLSPGPSPTWSSTVEKGSSPVGGGARVAQGSVSDLRESPHNVITHSRENPGPLLKPGFHRWHLKILSDTCKTPCTCGTNLNYGIFTSSIGGSMEKPPKFLQAQTL